jgi:hypothetical protein
MGTLLLWGLIVLGLFMGLVIISRLSLAPKGDRFYDHMHRGEEIPTPAKPLYWPALETLSPARNGKDQVQRDINVSMAAP